MHYYTWTIFLILVIINLSCSEDLLDEYVRHVEESSKYQQNTNKNKKNTAYKRNKRSMKYAHNIETEFIEEWKEKELVVDDSQRNKREVNPIKTVQVPYSRSSIQKAFGNRMMLKKLIQTTKTDKKQRLSKRTKRSPKLGEFDQVKLSRRNLEKRHVDSRTRKFAMQWTHEEILDEEGDIVLRWQPRHQEIAFRLEARTKGYVGIGFSPSGGMKGSDIVIGWVDDITGQPFLLDCHASVDKPNAQPIRDEVENYTLMRGVQNDTHTILEFRRALDTCDSEDYVLGTDTVRVIWALHHSDPPASGGLHYHGSHRGEQSLYLLGPPTVGYPEGTRNWDITLKNFVMPDNTDTFYWCKIVKAPTLQNKHHIVGYEPILGQRHKSHLHHMLVRECQMTGPAAVQISEWEKAASMDGATCYGPDMPQLWEACYTPLLAWAVGSKGEILPLHIGIPIAESSPRYYMLEVHFDNPTMKRAKDTSGLRIHYTHQLRKHDAGIISAGVALTPLHVVPPRQPEYRSAGYCSTDCTKQLFPKDGINVVSVLLHSHLAGKKMNLRHIRGGRELSPIVKDNKYDFNYQQTRMLSQEVTILPGDALLTECTYSTKMRSKPTIGGYTTANEMCLAFVLHYPKSELSACYSMPPVKYFFDTFGVKEFYDKDMRQLKQLFLDSSSETSTKPPKQGPPSLFPTFPPGSEDSAEANLKAEQAIRQARDYTIEGEDAPYIGPLDQLIIREPPEFRNKTFMSHLNEIPWEEELLTRRIEESFYSGQHLTFCRKRDDTLAIPEKIEMFPNFTQYVESSSKLQCSYRLQHSYSMSNHMSPLFSLLVLSTALLVMFK